MISFTKLLKITKVLHQVRLSLHKQSCKSNCKSKRKCLNLRSRSKNKKQMPNQSNPHLAIDQSVLIISAKFHQVDQSAIRSCSHSLIHQLLHIHKIVKKYLSAIFQTQVVKRQFKNKRKKTVLKSQSWDPAYPIWPRY